MRNSDLVKIIANTEAVCGGPELEKEICDIYVKALRSYDDSDVLVALEKCQKEIKGRVALSDIIKRIPSPWPTADEAWALCPKGESESTVWFDECASAWGATENLEEDAVARRMAFKAAYERELAQTDRRKPEWWPSLGTDKRHREHILRDAVTRGRLPEGHRALLGTGRVETSDKLLPDDTGHPDADKVRKLCALVGRGLSEDETKEQISEILEMEL